MIIIQTADKPLYSVRASDRIIYRNLTLKQATADAERLSQWFIGITVAPEWVRTYSEEVKYESSNTESA